MLINQCVVKLFDREVMGGVDGKLSLPLLGR